MSESVVCPSCRFQHAKRPDGLCPRCSARVHRPAGEDPLPRGARIAGALLVANAAAVVLETVLGVAGEGLGGHPPVAAAVHDLVVGFMLLGGHRKVLAWTIFRVCAGGILFTAMMAFRGEWLGAGFQGAFSVALLLLLLGNPARPRIAAALATFGLVMAFEVVGLVGIATGRQLLAPAVLSMRGEIEQAPERLTGTKGTWTMTPPPGWYLRSEPAARKDNPLSDRWLVRPDLDAHVLVISEHVEGVASIDPEALAAVVLENVKRGAKDVRILDRSVLARPASARMFHTLARSEVGEVEFLHVAVARGPDAYQVVAFAPRKGFAQARGDMDAAIASFEPGPR
jgi:hypothetical protein